MSARASAALSIFAAVAASTAHAQVFELDIEANAIAYSAHTHLLYATIPSTAGVPYGNQLVAISPLDASIVGSVFVGSEPGPVATSPDSATAYVGLAGAAAVRPVDLAAMTAGTQFSLGTSDIFGPLYAAEIAVMPGSPQTVAISRRDEGFSPSYQGVAIFDDGVMRPNVDESFTGGNSIAFGDSPNDVYGYDNEVSDFNLCRYSIDGSGIAGQTCDSNVISGYFVSIIFDGGTIFATSGAAVDADSFALQGTYQSSGPVAVDDANGMVLFANDGFIDVFDRDTYVPIVSFGVPSGGGFPRSAAACGPGCMAVVYDSNRILVIRGNGDPIFANGFD